MARTPTEKQTRKSLIDPALRRAGWDVDDSNQVGIEIPVDGFDPAAWQTLERELHQIREREGGYEVHLPAGISDYVLYRENREILAIVEAKRTSTDPRLAEAQTAFYVREIARRQSFQPFAFMTNGREIFFWDVGEADRRRVYGFFPREDLERLLFMRENRVPFSQAKINTAIIDRPYQMEALRRVTETFARGKRKALIVMATGTGKTRVAMAITDMFLHTNQARHILFVADRDALVTQALTEGFKTHIPNEPVTRLRTTRIERDKRLYVVTLQTLSNIYRQFSPAFFDLIIFDEVHRSIFNKWNEVLHYFDTRMVGLTATPAAYIGRNTFLEFECPEEIPTFLYSRQQAVDEGYLVKFELYRAQTRFQRKGIHGVDLSEEERNALIEKGIDPDEIDYAGTELERTVSNRDTLRAQWREFWDVARKDDSGLPGKTIVFAMTQAHALRLVDAFREVFPQYPGLAQVITYKSEYKGQLVKKFKEENLPRIAISVDMLEAGVNVPEVVNLVFMRPVHSPIKLEQMIGRGTRTQAVCTHPEWLPPDGKEDFLIIDFWENEFNKDPNTAIAQTLPVSVILFSTRLKLLGLYLAEDRDCDTPECQSLKEALREQVETIPRDALSVEMEISQTPEIARVWEDDFWESLTRQSLDFLTVQVAPLLRFAPVQDVAGLTFLSKIERLKLQRKEGKQRAAAHTAERIATDVELLRDNLLSEAQKQAKTLGRNPRRLLEASPAELDALALALAGQMKNKQRWENFRKLDLKDVIESRAYILLTGRGEEVYVDDYRRMVEQKVLDLVAAHPTIAALEAGEPVSDEQLLELERTLRQELSGPDLELNEGNIRRAYGERVDSLLSFVRRFLGLEYLPDYADILERQFGRYIAQKDFTADQIRFLRAVQSTLARRKHLSLPDLYEEPFTQFGMDAVERLFAPQEVEALINFTQKLAIA